MTKKSKKKTKKPVDAAKRKRLAHEAEAGVGGALAGAAVGSFAGPPGAIAGAVIGAAVGAVAELAAERDTKKRASRSRALDESIGVSGGDLGAPNLKHPPAKVGAYSAASSGSVDTSDDEPAEGPMQPITR